MFNDTLEDPSHLTQEQIAQETLERYSGSPITDFQPYVLLTNFPKYVEYFSSFFECPIVEGSMFKVAHDKKRGVSILDFKIGSPAAALVVDLCAFLPIRGIVLLGMCGGLRSDYQVGEFFIPIASIRGDGTSDFYFPSEVPAMANFTIQKVVSNVLEKENTPFHLGITHTTNKRFWEFNTEFKNRLKATRPQSVEMECATLFTAGYSHRLPLGALLLISDLPLEPSGIKTKKSSEYMYTHYMPLHINLGMKIMEQLKSVSRLNDLRMHVH